MMKSEELFEQIESAIGSAEKIFITAHDRPDGDALGSALGLGRVLKARGKNVTITGCLPVPERYRFLLDNDILEDISDVKPGEKDLMIVLDSGAIERSGPAAYWKKLSGKMVNLDHHISNSSFGDINCVLSDSSSTCEICVRLCRELNWTIPPAAANCFWVGLLTDTGSFSFSNTTPEALECGAHLMRCGANAEHTGIKLFQCKLLESLRLKAIAIESLEMHYGGRLGIVSLSKADFEKTGCSMENAGDIVDIPRNLYGVLIGLYMYELPDHSGTKISIRTSQPFDATELANKFGGGGHMRASGCTIDCCLEEAKEQFIKVLDELWGHSLGED